MCAVYATTIRYRRGLAWNDPSVYVPWSILAYTVHGGIGDRVLFPKSFFFVFDIPYFTPKITDPLGRILEPIFSRICLKGAHAMKIAALGISRRELSVDASLSIGVFFVALVSVVEKPSSEKSSKGGVVCCYIVCYAVLAFIRVLSPAGALFRRRGDARLNPMSFHAAEKEERATSRRFF